MDNGLKSSSRNIDYRLQTNMLRWDDAVMSLLKKRGVHFSVHYDGLIDGASLRSKARRKNVERLLAEGYSVIAVVVGTPQALDKLPATLEFFRRCGVKRYRLNGVSCEGRGANSPQPHPWRRAEAQFESAFFASQSDFAACDPVIMNKFVSYARWSPGRKKSPVLPTPRRCGAGTKSVLISADGAIYPCGFFTEATGPIGSLTGLPALDPGAVRAISICARTHPFYTRSCSKCRALPICGDYCALKPVRNGGVVSFCESQRRLMTLMEKNPRLATFIANRFLEYRTSRTRGSPKTCSRSRD